MKKIGQITRRAALMTAGVALFAACSDSADEEDPQERDDPMGGGHAKHEPDGGPPPEGITAAADPLYPIGTAVILAADHMPGMDGVQATISGAFDTTTYSVSYTPTDGGDPLTDHKWVVHEELDSPDEAPLAEDTEVVVNADHMPGMDGAEATIDSWTDETVYMVDFEMDGMAMTNHKWVVESEIQPAE